MFVFSVCTTYANYCSKNSRRGYRQAFLPLYTLLLPFHCSYFRSKASAEGIGKHLRLYIPSFRSFKSFSRGYRQTFPASYTLLPPFHCSYFYSKASHEGTSKRFRLHIPSFRHFTAHITRIISCTKELDQLGFVLSLNHIVHFL